VPNFNQPVVSELLEKACPSIQYRLRLELLNQPRTDEQMLALQSKILDDAAVKEVFSWQTPVGLPDR